MASSWSGDEGERGKWEAFEEGEVGVGRKGWGLGERVNPKKVCYFRFIILNGYVI